MLWLKKRLTSLFGGKSRGRDKSVEKQQAASSVTSGGGSQCSLAVGSSKNSSLRKSVNNNKCRCHKVVSQCNNITSKLLLLVF